MSSEMRAVGWVGALTTDGGQLVGRSVSVVNGPYHVTRGDDARCVYGRVTH